MNDIEFIETLKQKRNACDYSQSRLAQELQISRQNFLSLKLKYFLKQDIIE